MFFFVPVSLENPASAQVPSVRLSLGDNTDWARSKRASKTVLSALATLHVRVVGAAVCFFRKRRLVENLENECAAWTGLDVFLRPSVFGESCVCASTLGQ